MAQAAIWVAAVVTLFLFPPPGLDPTGDFTIRGSLVRFVEFLTAVLVGLALIAFRRFSSRRHLTVWVVASLVTLCGGAALFFLYNALVEDWTCDYHKVRVIIGSTLTPSAANSTNSTKNFQCEYMLENYQGHPEGVWLHSELIYREFVVSAMYTLTFLALVGTILTVVQALSISSQRDCPPV
jgi:hypothetical protein